MVRTHYLKPRFPLFNTKNKKEKMIRNKKTQLIKRKYGYHLTKKKKKNSRKNQRKILKMDPNFALQKIIGIRYQKS